MAWANDEPFWFRCPDFADVFLGREAIERLQTVRAIVCRDEICDERLQLGMGFVVVSLHCCYLEGTIHPLDLAIRLRVVHLGQPLLDAIFSTDAAEDLLEGVCVSLAIGELDAVIGQHGMDSGVSKSCWFALCFNASMRYAEVSEARGDPPCPASIQPSLAACSPA